MSHQRIMIIGCSGSGKSTLARQIGEKTGLPVIHLDQLYWRAGWQAVQDEEFDELLHQQVDKDAWIIDGNYNRTIQTRLDRCDTIIYLDYSKWKCILNAVKRYLKNIGKTRADMSADCPEKIDLEFIFWIWNFNKTHRNKYYEILKNIDNKEVYILRKHKDRNSLLRSFKNDII